METTRNFKIAWWVILLFISSLYLVNRYDGLVSGLANFFDILVAIIWFGLMLRLYI
jgi:hypothetical protein